MNAKIKSLIATLISTAAILFIAACGEFGVVIETPTPDVPATPTVEIETTPEIEVPEGVLMAREVALAHVRQNDGDSAPAEELAWAVENASTEGLVGSSAFRYIADDWAITIAFPVVAPENVIYHVIISDQAQDFAWEGKINSSGEIIESSDSSAGLPVIGWLGHVVGLPADAQFDDYLVLSPDGTGEFGLTGATPELEVEIVGLRDKPEPGKFANFWGTLFCDVPDYNGCQLVVDRLRYGPSTTDPQAIAGWEGTIITSTFNSALTYVFVLSGDYPVWHSIHSNDPAILAQLETLADTGSSVQVWGEFMTGIPDVNGTRVQADRIEIIEQGPDQGSQSTPTRVDPPADWLVYENEVYGYTLKHPPEATITHFGPEGFPSDDLPAGMSPDEYLTQLRGTLTDRLCVGIEYSVGIIYIAAPPNQEKFYTPCGRTGVGAGEMIDKTDFFEIDGEKVTASGFEFRIKLSDGGGETLDLHNEWFNITLSDGTRIQFGSTPRGDATYEDYLTKTKEVLRQILESYETIK